MPKHRLEAGERHNRDGSTAYTTTREAWTSQVIDTACAQAGIPYHHWLGAYVNGTALFAGAASLHELKAPCISCQLRGLVCVQLSRLDPLAIELSDRSCCGWCISLGMKKTDQGHKTGAPYENNLGTNDGRKLPSVAVAGAAEPSYEYWIRSRQIPESAFREFVQKSFQKDATVNWVRSQRSDPLSDYHD